MKFKKATMEDFDAAFDFIEKLWSYNTYDKDEIKDIYRQVIDDPVCSVFFAVENGQYRGFCHCAFFSHLLALRDDMLSFRDNHS